MRGPRTAMKSGPCLPQLEKALAQKRRPNTAIKKKKKKKEKEKRERNRTKLKKEKESGVLDSDLSPGAHTAVLPSARFLTSLSLGGCTLYKFTFILYTSQGCGD